MTPPPRPADELPLAGYIVLDLTRVLAGPYCTRILADMGARVIKVERPVDGDDMRRNYMQLEPGRTDQSSYFMRVNAGKESVAIDMAKPEGRAVIHDLAQRADVFVENFMPGVAAKLGCDEATLRSITPDLIYCSISGFGQTGPWRARPAFAHIINAASGLMHLEQGDEPAPRASNLQAADVLAGTHAVGAIVGALLRRGRTGKGAHLDVSMLEALISADSVTYAAVLNGGEEAGNPRPGMVVAPIGDRSLAMQFVGSGELWPRLLALMERPELGRDARFDTADNRRAHWGALREIVVAWLQATYPSVDAALAALAQARIPCAPVLRPADLVAEPHLAERGFFPAVPHPARGSVRITSTPYHLDHRPLGPRGPAAYRVGEHTREVLARDLGYSAERIEALRHARIVDIP